MRQVNQRDLIAGALLTGFGVFIALYSAEHYPVGDARRMGSGYFPLLQGWILAGLGGLIMLSSLRRSRLLRMPAPIHWRSLLAILAAVLVFSLLVNKLGLIPAAIALALVAAFAERPYHLRRTVLLGGGLSVLAWLIFSVGLKMTLPAFVIPG